MEITQVKVHRIERENSRLKGIATIKLDDQIAIHDIRIIQGDERMFVAMPSRKTATGEHKDAVHPLNQEIREMFEDVILAEYEKQGEAVTEEE